MISQYRPQIVTAAHAHGLDPALVEAIVWQESSDHRYAFRFEQGFFNGYIYGNRAAKAAAYGPLAACSYGLMQIMLEVAVEEGFTGRPETLFEVAAGLDAGCRHLGVLMAWAQDDERHAAAAYNAGIGGAASIAGEHYAASVLHWKTQLT